MESVDVSPGRQPHCSVCKVRENLKASKLPGRPETTLCDRCKTLRDRDETRRDAHGVKWRVDKGAREEQMHIQWDESVGAFLCAYTSLPLTTEWSVEGRAGPLHATWEHRDPRDPNKASQVVLVAWLINDMKADLSEREFKEMVRALAERFATPSVSFDTRALPRDWYRYRRA